MAFISMPPYMHGHYGTVVSKGHVTRNGKGYKCLKMEKPLIRIVDDIKIMG